jgi:hypothetical protein
MPARPEAANPLGHLRVRVATMHPAARARPAILAAPRVARVAAARQTTSVSGRVTARPTIGAVGRVIAGAMVARLASAMAPVRPGRAVVTIAAAGATTVVGVAARRPSARAVREAVAGTRTGVAAADLLLAGSALSDPDGRTVLVAVVAADSGTTIDAGHPGVTTVTIGRRGPTGGAGGRTKRASASAALRARPGATWPVAVPPTCGMVAGHRPPGGPRARPPVRDHGVPATARGVRCPGVSPSPRS